MLVSRIARRLELIYLDACLEGDSQFGQAFCESKLLTADGTMTTFDVMLIATFCTNKWDQLKLLVGRKWV
jgi:hypothetical protein